MAILTMYNYFAWNMSYEIMILHSQIVHTKYRMYQKKRRPLEMSQFKFQRLNTMLSPWMRKNVNSYMHILQYICYKQKLFCSWELK